MPYPIALLVSLDTLRSHITSYRGIPGDYAVMSWAIVVLNTDREFSTALWCFRQVFNTTGYEARESCTLSTDCPSPESWQG